MIDEKDMVPGQVLVAEVSFFDEENAARLARWINRRMGAGQAAKRGSHVLLGGIPRRVMQKAYLAIGATPEHEHLR